MTSLAEMRAALRQLEAETERGPAFNLAVVRTFTIETQIDALAFALSRIPCKPAITVGDFGVLEPLLFDAQSPIQGGNPDAVLVLWRLEDIAPDLLTASASWPAARRQATFEDICRRIEGLAHGHRAVSQAPLFLSTFPSTAQPLDDATRGFGIGEITARLNAHILALAAADSQVFVFDFAAWATSAGAAAFDRKLDFFASQPIAGNALASFAHAVSRTLKPLVVAPCKVLAVDLDDVLWGGILGEDGIDGLKLGHNFPGNVYLRIQQALLSLKSRGTLLTLVSKNNHDDVVEAFAQLPDMQLRLDDFAAVRINWERKSANLLSIADELRLGIDAFAFVDDSPFEREEVRRTLPAVRVIESGSDPLSILQALESTDVFDVLRTTAADLARAEDYRARHAREVPQNGDVGAFLESLEIEADVRALEATGITRAAQMLAKTNQFNVTTKRHSEATLRAFLADPNVTMLTVAARDRFGDQGVVGLAIAIKDGTATTVDTFLMSCRAIGRGVEDALWACLLDAVSQSDSATLHATYAATQKNALVAELFDRFGMQRVRDEPTARSYELTLPVTTEPPNWINLRRP
ncbi:MAG: HAD-IIIC family phosphatase [Candidatus Eremiobacteraeota bacterium]|nr:HAD-IIIC family phosphatase [Candidatus Eremiobacteraeota bacterium]